MLAGSIQTDLASIVLGWPRFTRGAREAGSKGLPGRPRLLAAVGDRSGTGRPGPSDLVKIDGPGSSSSCRCGIQQSKP
jgi:hypothetical protein